MRSAKCEVRSPKSEVSLRPRYIPDYATPRFRLTPRHFAYIKIAEGCNHPCSFCIIPRLRGPHRSRPPADILAAQANRIRAIAVATGLTPAEELQSYQPDILLKDLRGLLEDDMVGFG